MLLSPYFNSGITEVNTDPLEGVRHLCSMGGMEMSLVGRICEIKYIILALFGKYNLQ